MPVCHCLPQAKQCAPVVSGTASAKQWHTAEGSLELPSNPGYRPLAALAVRR